MTVVRTRFAPSPTGLLHIGSVRTALFCWAYARKHKGQFILRIEDTDLERSTPESVAAILEGLRWLKLDYDEGPFYQMHRLKRYQDVLQQLVDTQLAYPCYATKEELDQMRTEQEARGEKPRYDRRWRPELGKVLPPAPAGVSPVIRFKTPLTGCIAWDDLVKGRIEINNAELDDLILARPDGTPTYNFCVVVDDWDMAITHVIRGDDHVNNTPRQIHLFQALGAPLPCFAHLPMIHNQAGQKLSKRRDAVSVVDYEHMGFLPEALLNNLARLGWGHGDDEFFTMQQFVEWFDLKEVSPSPSRFDEEKLRWLNAQYIKTSDTERLCFLVSPLLNEKKLILSQGPSLSVVLALLKPRAQTLVELANQVEYFYRPVRPSQEISDKYLTPSDIMYLALFRQELEKLTAWNQSLLSELMKSFVKAQGIAFSQLGFPLRAKLCGTVHTPSIDAVLALLGQAEVLSRLTEDEG